MLKTINLLMLFFRCIDDDMKHTGETILRTAIDPRPVIGEINSYRLNRKLGVGVFNSVIQTTLLRGSIYFFYATLAAKAYITLKPLFE